MQENGKFWVWKRDAEPIAIVVLWFVGVLAASYTRVTGVAAEIVVICFTAACAIALAVSAIGD